MHQKDGPDMSVNKDGFLVNVNAYTSETRTYACTDRDGLEELIFHLTGRSAISYARDERGLPRIPKIIIASGLHIYNGE